MACVSLLLIPSATFTPSNVFTPPMFFTPRGNMYISMYVAKCENIRGVKTLDMTTGTQSTDTDVMHSAI